MKTLHEPPPSRAWDASISLINLAHLWLDFPLDASGFEIQGQATMRLGDPSSALWLIVV